MVAVSYERAIPAEVLPRQNDDSWEATAILIATFYLDEDIEYPPGMMGESRLFLADKGKGTALLVRILENPRLSHQKKLEAVKALTDVDPKYLQAALPVLLSLVGSADEEIKWYVTRALVELRDDHAIPLLIGRIGKYLHWDWADELCKFGPRAVSAEGRLIHVVGHSDWASDQHAAVRVLACIRSAKAVPVLLDALSFEDWELAESIARALGNIEDTRPEVVAALDQLAVSHWSAIVRRAAAASLAHLRDRATPRPALEENRNETHNQDGSTTIVVRLGPYPVDHGLPYCDPSGKYSIDGETWFNVRWIRPGLKLVPPDYPKDVDDYGTRDFLRVGDGWLYGAYRGHYDGSFQHVSYGGAVTELGLGDASIMGFVRHKGKILAYGYEVLSEGEGGSLFDVRPDDAGRWAAKRLAVLPSPPMARGTGPHGEFLFTDEPNTYAVIDNAIIPLKCEKTFANSFFDE